MAIVRTYECGECGCRFDKLHFDRADPPPPCPGCQALAAKQSQVPAGFAIKGNMSRAVDITQSIMENDLGYTDFKDSVREGEVAVKTPPHLEKAVASMWKPSGDIIAAAKAGATAAAKEGVNPLSMMQRVSKAHGGGAHRVPISPVNKVR
jgi:predicted nucleic acid-binding Zn ribbon protein